MAFLVDFRLSSNATVKFLEEHNSAMQVCGLYSIVYILLHLLRQLRFKLFSM